MKADNCNRTVTDDLSELTPAELVGLLEQEIDLIETFEFACHDGAVALLETAQSQQGVERQKMLPFPTTATQRRRAA